MSKETKGLKKLTNANSVHVRLAPGGKEFIKDNSKPKRLYKVKGESN